MLNTFYGEVLKKNEKILWVGKRHLKSLWLILFIGCVTFLIYGIGIIFILYAMLIWLKVDYIITSFRVMKVTRHYVSVKHKIQGILHKNIQGIYTVQSNMGKTFNFWDLVIENNQKIVFKGIKETEDIKRIIDNAKNKIEDTVVE